MRQNLRRVFRLSSATWTHVSALVYAEYGNLNKKNLDKPCIMLYCVTLAYFELHPQVQTWRSNLASCAALTVSLTSKSMFLQRGGGVGGAPTPCDWGRGLPVTDGSAAIWNKRRGHLCQRSPPAALEAAAASRGKSKGGSGVNKGRPFSLS